MAGFAADTSRWAGPTEGLAARVRDRARANLESYRANPLLVEEHTNIELQTAEGGYGRRQIYELIQNGADALLGEPGGAVEVVLTESALYCANEGAPIDRDGVDALLMSHVSRKRGLEIGRFGLGFKSVLEVSDRPTFLSRSGSFGWDSLESERLIREIVPSASRTPRLRLAHPIDPLGAAADDEVLAELMSWATTVVKLPLHATPAPWLAKDIVEFPAPFLLFARHVGRLTLSDRSPSLAGSATLIVQRVIEMQPDGNMFTLTEDGAPSGWRVFTEVYRPSLAAQHDAGEMTNREEVPLSWAVPLEGRAGQGLLWAFFPTEYQTTLRGILNAPWKTNPDRKNLLDGLFNEDLLLEFARMVVANLPELLDPSDPGRVLDLLPGRGRESEVHNWADRILRDKVFEFAAAVPSLPNQLGELTEPARLTIHPENLARDILDAWAAYRPLSDWCHPSVEGTNRRPRADRLIDAAGGRRVDIRSWLEFLTSDGTLEGSAAAIRIAAMCVDAEYSPKYEVLTARIVRTTDERLVAPNPTTLFLPGDYVYAGDVELVDPRLTALDGVVSALQVLGLRVVDATADLEAMLDDSFETLDDADWKRLWGLTQSLGVVRAAEILREAGRLPNVLTLAGVFKPFQLTLLPGQIVPADGSRDSDVAIDVTYHDADMDLLRELGATPAPVAMPRPETGRLLAEYQRDAANAYLANLPPNSPRPNPNLLTAAPRPRFGQSYARPLDPITALGDEGRAAFTEALVSAEPALDDWEVKHKSQRAYRVMPWPCPTRWVITHEGRIRTSLGPVPVSQAVSRELHDHAEVLPVATCGDDLAAALALPSSLAELPGGVWETTWDRINKLNDYDPGHFYADSAAAGATPPTNLRCRIGSEESIRPPREISVVFDPAELRALEEQHVPGLLVSSREARDLLVERWGLNEAEDYVRTQIHHVALADEAALVDEFPSLKWTDVPESTLDIPVVRCSELIRQTLTVQGKSSQTIPFHFDGRTLYWGPDVTPLDFLQHANGSLSLGLTEDSLHDSVRIRADDARRRRERQIRQLETDEERVVAAIGRGALLTGLPAGLLRALQPGVLLDDSTELGRVSLAVFGYDILSEFSADLDRNGLEPPRTWRGTALALTFVRRLGFPAAYAGFEQPRRPALLEVDGPPLLPDLHPFQEQIVANIDHLLAGTNGARGLLALPTGAGKTRIAVQALVDAVRDGRMEGPILWVAQNDELNEQAVQTWSYVWRARGPRMPLTIARLWAGNEAEPASGSTQVVVATIDKLRGRFESPDYRWLSQATCVVIDEAHHATTASYTGLLRWLGIGRGDHARPMIGLTATPFRGSSKEETKALVQRFGATRLDTDVFSGRDPYSALQDMGVLSRVRHRLLGGTSIELSRDELQSLTTYHSLPPSAQERLGLDVDRNRTLIDDIRSLPEDYSILLFATSVDHAQTMAALLTVEGITAKSITQATDPGARRRYIEHFRDHELRVLTNYNVLTEGFDAPAVRAVYVARPTYSPNTYQQMIGRGLRGPLNGGKDECLIVNVADNVAQYGEELAFHEFDRLWAWEDSEGHP